MQYFVRAVSADHLMTDLTIDGRDEADALRQVVALGLFAASIRPARRSSFGFLRGQRGAMSLVLFSQELLALLNAGLSIVEALEALLEKEGSITIRGTLTGLLEGLRQGKRFSGVLAEQPTLFPPLYIGIIKAAEGTSDLPRSLSRYIDYQQRIDVVRSKVISAAIYPLILLLVGGGVTLFLIGYVVPRFAEVYRGAGRDLPWMSQMLLDWGQFASANTKLLLAIITATIFILVTAIRQTLSQGGLGRLVSRFPGIGERVRIYELSRMYLTLGMLLEGGISIVPSLQTVEGIVSSSLRTGLQSATMAIQNGTPLSVGFEANRLTTPISLRMLRVGERTGALGTMLTQSAAFYDGEISRWIDRFTRMFEPLLMAAIGLIVGAIVVLLYMPIFDLAGSLS